MTDTQKHCLLSNLVSLAMIMYVVIYLSIWGYTLSFISQSFSIIIIIIIVILL